MGSHELARGQAGDGMTAILNSIRRIMHALRVAARAAEKQVGLSGAQLFVLHKLAKQPPLSLNELADLTCTHQSSVSVVVQRLVERKLVARSRADSDARRLEVRLTPAGRARLRQAPDLAQVRLIDAIGAMTAARRRAGADVLAQLANAVGPDTSPPAMFFEDETHSPASKKSHLSKKIAPARSKPRKVSSNGSA